MAITIDYNNFGTTFKDAYGVLTNTTVNRRKRNSEDIVTVEALYSVYISEQAFLDNESKIGTELIIEEMPAEDIPQYLTNFISSIETQFPPA